MPQLDRRRLLGATAATTAALATASLPLRASTEKPDLKGKSILITGSSSGFGRLGAEHFARLGAKVFATMRGLPRPEGEELRALAAADKLDIHLIEIDVLSDEQVAAGVAEAERINGGPLDVLVNNAGIGITSPVEVQDMEATRLIFDTNVFGCHRMARAVLPGMRARKAGQIFQVSSQLGRVIVPYSGHYSATKFALEAMSEQLAYELVPHNIDVTIIEPGGYPTEVWVNRNAYSRELKGRAGDIHTAGYPEQVARTITGLCTNSVPADALRSHADAHSGSEARARSRLLQQPHFPQGAPTSPVIANLISFRFDKRVTGLARCLGANYSRYADDLLFSGDHRFKRQISRFVIQVAAIALEEGFTVNHHKTRVMAQSVRQHATGLVLNQHANVDRREYDQLKAILHNSARHGPDSQNRREHPDFRNHLLGRINYIGQFSAHRGAKLHRLFDTIHWQAADE